MTDWDMQPEIAKRVTLDLERKRLMVNGGVFPWHLTKDGPEITPPGPDGIALVTVTFMAEHVEIIRQAPQEG